MTAPRSPAETMPRDEFLRRMEEILRMPPGVLKGHELLRDTKDWDSTAILEFMALVDCRLGQTLDVESILASETYNDLYSLIK